MTIVCGLIGANPQYSLSPLMHHAAFKQSGLDGRYELWPVPPGGLEAFIRHFRAEGLRGASVTIPHKEAVVPLLDGLTEQAKNAGAVNTLFWKGGELWGDNTDSYGFAWPIHGRHFSKLLLLGSGGAARGVLAAMALARGQNCLLRGKTGISTSGRPPETFISGRTLQRALALASAFPLFEPRPEVLPWERRADFFTRLEPEDEALVVNATPLGMSGHFAGESPLGADVWGLAPRPEKITAYDLVYAPAERPFLQNAALAGCACVDGLSMLAAQAARQFAIWTGCELPPEYFVAVLEQAGSLNK